MQRQSQRVHSKMNKGASLRPFNTVKVLAVKKPVTTLDSWANEATNYM